MIRQVDIADVRQIVAISFSLRSVTQLWNVANSLVLRIVHNGRRDVLIYEEQKWKTKTETHASQFG